MPLYDFSCSICGFSAEYVTSMDTQLLCCPNCQGEASRRFSFGQSFEFREDPAWLRDTLEVVAKDSQYPVDREFLKNPTRANYHAWMKFHGIRPAENEGGAPPKYKRPEMPDVKSITDYCYEQRRKRERIEVRER